MGEGVLLPHDIDEGQSDRDDDDWKVDVNQRPKKRSKKGID